MILSYTSTYTILYYNISILIFLYIHFESQFKIINHNISLNIIIYAIIYYNILYYYRDSIIIYRDYDFINRGGGRGMG